MPTLSDLILCGVPVNRSAIPDACQFYHPEANYQQATCKHCNEVLWVGPKQVKLLVAGARLFCIRCIMDANPRERINVVFL